MPGLVAAEAMEESPEAVPASPMVKGIKSESENKSPRSPLSPKSPTGARKSPGEVPVQPTENSFENNQTGNGGINGAAVTATTSTSTSIEQLYENVCQMKSSGDQSPSRASSAEQSEVEEFRIDSELQQLVGGENPIQKNSSAEMQKPVKEEGEKRVNEEKKPVKEGKEKPQKEKIVSNGVKSATQGKEVHSEIKKSSSVEKNKAVAEKPIKPVSSIQSRRPSRLQITTEVSTRTSPSNKGVPGKITPTKSPAKQQSKSPDENSERNPGEDSPLIAQRKLFQSPDKPPKKVSPASMRKKRSSPVGLGKIHQESDETPEVGLENPDLGPFLLKLARNLIASGDNPYKALECAVRASKSFEICADGKPSLELVMSLHILAAIHCSLGQYEQAIPVLERSIEVPVLEEGPEHALAAFAGRMQLGDTYAMLGQLEHSIECYKAGLEIQKQVLGDMDPRVGETCRYLAEAHVQAMQFDEAEKLCQHALDIHKEHSTPASIEEAADRRLMALIYDGKGDYEAALEHLVLASMAMISNGQEMEVASVDCSIGDTYLALGRYDEAVFAYQKSLTVFKSTKGENNPAVAAVFVRLADLYYKTGKLRESKTYCENALRIYGRPIVGHPPDDIASGLTEVSAIYEAMNEPEQALRLLQKAFKILDDAPGQQSAVAGIEAQMGVIYYVLGKYGESHASLKNAVTKLRASGEKKSAFFGIVLNQMGLACVQRYAINEAADLFEEARSILEEVCGPYHPDTLAVYSNLAGTYDAMGRLEDAIGVLEYIVGVREEKLGTANPDVDDEKKRLAELLKEAGRARNRKAKSLETLLQSNSHKKKKEKAK